MVLVQNKIDLISHTQIDQWVQLLLLLLLLLPVLVLLLLLLLLKLLIFLLLLMLLFLLILLRLLQLLLLLHLLLLLLLLLLILLLLLFLLHQIPLVLLLLLFLHLLFPQAGGGAPGRRVPHEAVPNIGQRRPQRIRGVPAPGGELRDQGDHPDQGDHAVPAGPEQRLDRLRLPQPEHRLLPALPAAPSPWQQAGEEEEQHQAAGSGSPQGQ